jgi:molybdate transport system substrate-binding protein
MNRFWQWLLVALLAAAAPAHADDGPVIAAASDLKFALDEIVVDFQKSTGRSLRVTYGSSGNFFRQIAQDAPFELFLSADEEFIFKLADQGLTLDRGALYATGRIVLFAPNGSGVRPDAGLADLRQALADGRLVKLAIANPEHAPYGRAAMEALKSAGLWAAAEPKLVLGENVSQAAQFAVSGSTQAGIFALSLALAPNLRGAGSYVTIPESLHRPLRQRMVLLRKAGTTARAFYAFAQGAGARAIFKRYGFLLPGESAP